MQWSTHPYLNVGGTFFYLLIVLDGASRAIIHWDIRNQMTALDVECILQKARELYPEAKPRIISDNGPQFIANEFKVFIREVGMTHVRTSPYYPQSNGKLERFNRSLKEDAVRPAAPSTVEDARRVVTKYIRYYNHERLHSAIGYITPVDAMAGRSKQIWAERDKKLEQAREQRAQRRQQARTAHGAASPMAQQEVA